MSKRILLIVLSFALVAALVFTGCTPARRPYDNQNAYDNMDSSGGMNTNYGENNRTGMTGMNNGRANNNGISNWGNRDNGNYVGYRNTDENAMRADQISTEVKKIEGVENATVVVTGNTAYVGIDLSQGTKNKNERDIKRQVAQMVRSTGRDINTVYVSAEVDFMDRLRNVGEGIRNGRPVDAFTNELNEMVKRISPTR